MSLTRAHADAMRQQRQRRVRQPRVMQAVPKRVHDAARRLRDADVARRYRVSAPIRCADERCAQDDIV